MPWQMSWNRCKTRSRICCHNSPSPHHPKRQEFSWRFSFPATAHRIAERCLKRRGAAYAFIESSGRVHLICAESETEVYDVIYKARGQLDGITAFRVNSMTYRGVTYEFNVVSEYVEFLSWRGDTMLSASQFPGPFTFVWP